MTRHIHDLDWERTVAYAATPSSQGINLVRNPPDGSPGVPRERRAELLSELSQQLREEPLVLDVLTRTEAFAGPHAGRAPDLSLVLADGAAVSILRSDTIVRERELPNGNHRWQGILIACGPELRRGARCDEVSIVDVAPLLLHSLDVPVPDDLDGRVPTELFDPEALRRRPIGHAPAGAPAAPVPAAAAGADYDPEEEAAVVNRLRALGYLE
jgi:predicted AlkP superfamily phosphohydrolase/phosphomutase